MKKGQANIVIFPILILLLISAWFLSMYSILTTATETSQITTLTSNRLKEFINADLRFSDALNPINSQGKVKNSGITVLSNIEAYHLNSTSITQISFPTRLASQSTSDVTVNSIEWGDLLVIKSDQGFWVTVIEPVELKSGAALSQFAEGGSVVASFVLDRITSTPDRSYTAIGVLNATLNTAVGTQNDDVNYTVDKNDDAEFEWDKQGCLDLLSARLTIAGKADHLSQATTIQVKPFDGEVYATGDTCDIESTYTECKTSDLSFELVSENNILKIQIDVQAVNFIVDYIYLEAVCAV